MERRDIKIYILKHRKNYSQESIINQLVESGADRNEVNSIYDEINNNSSLNKTPNSNKKTKSGLGLTLILIGFIILIIQVIMRKIGFIYYLSISPVMLFFPLIGIFLTIIGIVLGFKARKINPDKKLGLIVIILGFIFLIFYIIIFIAGIQFWFQSYQSGVSAKVENAPKTSSIFTIERLESDGAVYVKNSGEERMDVLVKIPKGVGCSDLENLSVAALSVQMGKVPGCTLTKGEKIDVVIVAPNGVFQSTQVVR